MDGAAARPRQGRHEDAVGRRDGTKGDGIEQAWHRTFIRCENPALGMAWMSSGTTGAIWSVLAGHLPPRESPRLYSVQSLSLIHI